MFICVILLHDDEEEMSGLLRNRLNCLYVSLTQSNLTYMTVLLCDLRNAF